MTIWDRYAALETLAAREYDLVLSDVMVPQLDGCGPARALHATPPPGAIPLVC